MMNRVRLSITRSPARRKQEFYDWLRLERPTDPDEAFQAGYQHYAYGDPDFYKGLCSESRVVRALSGKVEWVKDPAVRNEPLDLAVLCRAAATVCGIDRFTEDEWAALERNVETEPPRAPPDDEFWGERDSNWLGGKDWFK